MSRKFSIRPTDILQSRSRRKCFPRFFVKIPRTLALAKMMNTETSLRECPERRYTEKIARDVILGVVDTVVLMLA